MGQGTKVGPNKFKKGTNLVTNSPAENLADIWQVTDKMYHITICPCRIQT